VIRFDERDAARRLERERELAQARKAAAARTYISLDEYRRRALWAAKQSLRREGGEK
jgi:hypothetical protein